MERVSFNGWSDCVRLANEEVELIITTAVGPRIVRFGFIGEKNMFAEFEGQQGGSGEAEWMIRGGHRLWIAPEEAPLTYELDNGPIEVEEIPNGVRTIQPIDKLSGILKTMDITLAPDSNRVEVLHTITNRNDNPVDAAPWALSVMAPDGMAVIPKPAFIPHTDRLTHNQEWSIWGYTDFSDPRWTLGSRYTFFRQDRNSGPNKLGMAHREGWVGYLLGEFLFTKYFTFEEGATYPDAGMNFETFSNEDMLEVESLGPLVTLASGDSTSHTERWTLNRGVDHVETEDDADRLVKPLV
jgi:hypothetical protein